MMHLTAAVLFLCILLFQCDWLCIRNLTSSPDSRNKEGARKRT